MPATTKKKAAVKKPAVPVFRYPGQEQLTVFLKDNRQLLNLSELERICNFPSGTLRHICAGTRTMEPAQYNKIKEALLPKLSEFVLLLQLHQGKTRYELSRYASAIDDEDDDDDY